MPTVVGKNETVVYTHKMHLSWHASSLASTDIIIFKQKMGVIIVILYPNCPIYIPTKFTLQSHNIRNSIS